MEESEESYDRMVRESKMKKSVILDVGGERFNTFRRTLEHFPTTRLGKLMRAASIKEQTADFHSRSNSLTSVRQNFGQKYANSDDLFH